MMVLADTSVWVAHFREGLPGLVNLLEFDGILIHQLVIGELACGNLSNRRQTIEYLGSLPLAIGVSDPELMALIEQRRLWGRGLGWVDVSLLASALVSNCPLWTLDRRLAKAARELGICF